MSTIEERIRKLLALADSPNEHEAALAAEKAQALMLRHGVELAALAQSQGERLEVSEHRLHSKIDPWRRRLAGAVARSCGGRMLWQADQLGPRNQGQMWFYGPAGTVHGMVELYGYLEAQLIVISATATARRRNRGVHGRTWRASFLQGAVGRIIDRLQERCDQVEQGVDAGRALVLLKTAVDREVERQHPDLVHDAYRPSVDERAYRAGLKAGDRVDFGDRGLPAEDPALPRRGAA